MRLNRATLGDFVPGRFALPQNPVFGMGDFVPGSFAVPQNPILMQRNGMGEFVPAFFQVPGEFVPAAFNVPPVPMGTGLGHDCGCGCGGRCGGGMGQIDWSVSGVGIVDAIGGAFGTTTANIPQIPNWVFYLAGAAGVYMIFFQAPTPRYRRR